MKLRTFLLLAVGFGACAGTAQAALFVGAGPGGAIPDGSGSGTPGTSFVSTITVPVAINGPITSVSIAFDRLSHTWVGDLTMVLWHPDGVTSLDIMSRPGRGTGTTFGYPADFSPDNSYAFADGGATLFDVAPPGVIPSGTYAPSSNPNPPESNLLPYVYTLTSFFDAFGGLAAPGDWTLVITDWAGGDTGSLGQWILAVTTSSTSVPEPSTLALLGLASLLLVGRRKGVRAT